MSRRDTALTIATDGVVSREVDDGLVIYQLDQERFVELNATGRLLWGALSETSHTRDALATLLAERFEIGRAQAIEDVERFTGELCDAGLLVRG